MSSLQELIEVNKESFEINASELKRRVQKALEIYELVKPPRNLDQVTSKLLGKQYKNLHQMLIDSATYLNNGYLLNLKLTASKGNKLYAYYIKSDAMQASEKKSLKENVKQDYIQELEQEKLAWVKTITEQAAAAAEVDAIAQATKREEELQNQLLQMLNSK